MTKATVPNRFDLQPPTLQALRNLGGSGTIHEINAEVIRIMNLTQEQLDVLQDPGKGSQTRLASNLAWARSYLKGDGLLENSSRGVWALTAKGQETQAVNLPAVLNAQQNDAADEPSIAPEAADSPPDADGDLEWREQVAAILHRMDPAAFERLFQRVLREDGFYRVEVKGRSGDGGIDGEGIVRVGGFLSFRVLFQCKRYRGSVGAGAVRDFRGTMAGRSDKGIIVTTGRFTRDAEREASRTTPEVDLIDGEQLMDKLKELSLGVKTEPVVVERVVVDSDWFAGI